MSSVPQFQTHRTSSLSPRVSLLKFRHSLLAFLLGMLFVASSARAQNRGCDSCWIGYDSTVSSFRIGINDIMYPDLVRYVGGDFIKTYGEPDVVELVRRLDSTQWRLSPDGRTIDSLSAARLDGCIRDGVSMMSGFGSWANLTFSGLYGHYVLHATPRRLHAFQPSFEYAGSRATRPRNLTERVAVPADTSPILLLSGMQDSRYMFYALDGRIYGEWLGTPDSSTWYQLRVTLLMDESARASLAQVAQQDASASVLRAVVYGRSRRGQSPDGCHCDVFHPFDTLVVTAGELQVNLPAFSGHH